MKIAWVLLTGIVLLTASADPHGSALHFPTSPPDASSFPDARSRPDVSSHPGASSSAPALQQRPKAEVTSVVETSPVRPGAAAELALKVKLPADVHVQSDKPRDPNLIPTVLTLDAPAGVKVESITYPKASDLKQKSGGPPLAVFGSEFSITVKVSVPATIGEGDLNLPGKLRYQACNESLCFPPATATAQWTLKVQHVE